MKRKIQFEEDRARKYRKCIDVLAYQSDDPIRFLKSWGTQELRANGWVIVSLSDEGEPTGDIYGCDAAVFSDTYEPSPSNKQGRYRKKGLIQAYQPGFPFIVDTVLSDGHLEVDGAQTDADDAWIVKGPGGEVYIIDNDIFQRTYVDVEE